jgi:hypothetical protein
MGLSVFAVSTFTTIKKETSPITTTEPSSSTASKPKSSNIVNSSFPEVKTVPTYLVYFGGDIASAWTHPAQNYFTTIGLQELLLVLFPRHTILGKIKVGPNGIVYTKLTNVIMTGKSIVETFVLE